MSDTLELVQTTAATSGLVFDASGNIVDHPVIEQPTERQIVLWTETGETIEMVDLELRSDAVPLEDFDAALNRWQLARMTKPGKANKNFMREFPFEYLVELAYRGRSGLASLSVLQWKPTVVVVGEGVIGSAIHPGE